MPIYIVENYSQQRIWNIIISESLFKTLTLKSEY